MPDVGTRFVEAVAAQDTTALTECFVADVLFRALTPPGLRERTSAAEAAALVTQWFGDSTELRLLDSHGAEVGDRLRAWWGDAPYDREDWWEFEKFRDPER